MTRLGARLDRETAEVDLEEKDDLMSDSDKILNATARPNKFYVEPGVWLMEADMSKHDDSNQKSSPSSQVLSKEFVCPKEEKEEKLFERHVQVSVYQHNTTLYYYIIHFYYFR